VNTHANIIGGLVFAAALTAIIAITGSRLASFEIVGPTIAFQYPWRLAESTHVAQLTAWLGYAMHNLYVWFVLAWTQRQKPSFDAKLRGFNWALLVGNAVFILLHILQTQLFYDGLAQDVPEATALGSVALMLMVILVLEAPRRGLFFGRARLDRRLTRTLRKYHGYLFSWAIIYTFWYHPTEVTQGHLIGFFYMFMLLWQSVLIFNRAHINRWWTLALEIAVIPHAILVAIAQPEAPWRMFGFGFAAIFIVTQLHGLGFNRTTRSVFAAIFVVALLLAYGVFGDIGSIHEILRIPVAEFLVAGLIYGVLLAAFRVRGPTRSA
jgi:hypothetical protein|tara:strand:- start:550 stop:1518 length:969 start_codon:yes stop_codon:yes gene_type:complete